MKWISKKIKSKRAKPGDERTDLRFSFFPITCPVTGYTHWLEFVYVTKKYTVTEKYPIYPDCPHMQHVGTWNVLEICRY